MEVIYSPIQSGKTRRLIERCAKEGGYIVCLSHKEVFRVADMAKSMGLKIPCPMTHQDFIDKEYYGQGVQKLWIDNADILLQRMAKCAVGGISITKD